MWFKNLVVYQFTQPFTLSCYELEEKLQQKTLRPCGSQDFSTYGWVPALEVSSLPLVHQSSDCFRFCAGQEERILPPAVVTDALKERVEQIELEQDRQIFSKEKKALKDDIVMELLPKAFTRRKYTDAYIDCSAGLLIVNTASFTAAEMLTSCLRECLGTLPITSPQLKNAPGSVMTHWLQVDEVPERFDLGDEYQLREPGDEGGTITARHEVMWHQSIDAHLCDGKQVSKLGISWNDSLNCVLRDDLVIQRLRFTEVIQEKVDDCEAETAAEQADVDFTIMTGTLRPFLNDLFNVFGGVEDRAND